MTKEEKLRALKTALKDYIHFLDGVSNLPKEYFDSGLCHYFHIAQGVCVYEAHPTIPEIYEISSDRHDLFYLYKPGEIEPRIEHLNKTIEYIKSQ